MFGTPKNFHPHCYSIFMDQDQPTSHQQLSLLQKKIMPPLLSSLGMLILPLRKRGGGFELCKANKIDAC